MADFFYKRIIKGIDKGSLGNGKYFEFNMIGDYTKIVLNSPAPKEVDVSSTAILNNSFYVYNAPGQQNAINLSPDYYTRVVGTLRSDGGGYRTDALAYTYYYVDGTNSTTLDSSKKCNKIIATAQVYGTITGFNVFKNYSSRYLIKYDSSFYTFNGQDFIISQSQLFNSDNFITNGFNSLQLDTPIKIKTLFPDNSKLKILLYSEDLTLSQYSFLLYVNELSYLQMGDLSPCRYTAGTSGQVGFFSELGTTTADLIPPASSATPNGSFNFIYVGKDYKGRKKFIADRNIQHSISWDILNSAGICSEKQIKENVVPIMTGYTTNGITISASSEWNANFRAWMAFDRVNDSSGGSYSWASLVPAAWIKVSFDISKQISGYTIKSRGYQDANVSSPKSWTFEGSNDNTTWSILDTRTSETGWVANEKREYTISNVSSYKYYRLNITANNGQQYTCIDEIELFEQKSYNSYIRLLTGGTSATDTDNEWDKIIVNSTLGGTITAGDDNVWHWNGLRGWTSTTIPGTSANRVVRGSLTENLVSMSTSNASNYSATNYGFRPVLLVEQLLFDKYLIKKDSNYYSIDSKYYDESTHEFIPLTLAGGADPNGNDIDTFGFNNLSQFINSMTKGSDTFKPCDKLNNCEIKYYVKK